MKILFYLPAAGAAAARLLTRMEATALPFPREIHRSLADLSKRLRRMTGDIAAAVILTGSEDELKRLLWLRNDLSDVRIILILPDGGKSILAKAHGLFPRFIAYADSDFQDVADVLRKMLSNG